MRGHDGGVSTVLGALLMLAVMMTLVPGMILLRSAISDEMDAQREGAERAAWCARNPSVGPPACPSSGPLPGYECKEIEADAWLCTAAIPTPTLPPPELDDPILG